MKWEKICRKKHEVLCLAHSWYSVKCVCACCVFPHSCKAPEGPWDGAGWVSMLSFSLRQVVFSRSPPHDSQARAEIIINSSSPLNPDFFLLCSRRTLAACALHFFCLAWGAVSIGGGAKRPCAVAELIKCTACPRQVLTEARVLRASRMAWLPPSAGSVCQPPPCLFTRASQLSLRWDLVKTCHMFSESLPKIQSSCLPNMARGEACECHTYMDLRFGLNTHWLWDLGWESDLL